VADTDTSNITDILRKKWFPDWPASTSLTPTYSGGDVVGSYAPLSLPAVSTPADANKPSAPTPAVATPVTPADPTKPSTPQTSSVSPTGLDQYGYYDPDYDSAMNSFTAQENAANSAYTQGLVNLQGQFDVPLAQLSAQRSDDLDTLAAQMAQQGILRSSNNLVGQGRLENNYQTAFGNIAQQIQQGQQGLEQNRLNILQQILQGRNQADTAHAAFVANKEQERAQAIAQAAAAAEAQRKQDEVNAQLQAQAQAAQQAYQQANTPQVTPTGQIAPPPAQPNGWGFTPTFDQPTMTEWGQTTGATWGQPPQPPPPVVSPPPMSYPSAPSEWNNVPAGWFADINKPLWWS